jgi:hypothetical protein
MAKSILVFIDGRGFGGGTFLSGDDNEACDFGGALRIDDATRFETKKRARAAAETYAARSRIDLDRLHYMSLCA